MRPSTLLLTKCGLLPHGDGRAIVATRAMAAFAITEMVSLPSSATYTFPVPRAAAMLTGITPTGAVPRMSPVAASKAATMLVDAFVTQTVSSEVEGDAVPASHRADAGAGSPIRLFQEESGAELVPDTAKVAEGALRVDPPDATAVTVAMNVPAGNAASVVVMSAEDCPLTGTGLPRFWLATGMAVAGLAVERNTSSMYV